MLLRLRGWKNIGRKWGLSVNIYEEVSEHKMVEFERIENKINALLDILEYYDHNDMEEEMDPVVAEIVDLYDQLERLE